MSDNGTQTKENRPEKSVPEVRFAREEDLERVNELRRVVSLSSKRLTSLFLFVFTPFQSFWLIGNLYDHSLHFGIPFK